MKIFKAVQILGPFLFVLVMDEPKRNIQNEVPWYMLIEDDIVLNDETRKWLALN